MASCYIKGHLKIGCREIEPQWNTDIEEFFLNQLSAKQKYTYIWGRLGNSYYNGGRPELAVAVYERSIQVLDWAEICNNERGYLTIRPSFMLKNQQQERR